MKYCCICGEEKTRKDFFCIYGFSHYRKKQWCQDCQKLFLDMKKQEKKEQEKQEKAKIWITPPNFTVSFL